MLTTWEKSVGSFPIVGLPVIRDEMDIAKYPFKHRAAFRKYGDSAQTHLRMLYIGPSHLAPVLAEVFGPDLERRRFLLDLLSDFRERYSEGAKALFLYAAPFAAAHQAAFFQALDKVMAFSYRWIELGKDAHALEDQLSQWNEVHHRACRLLLQTVHRHRSAMPYFAERLHFVNRHFQSYPSFIRAVALDGAARVLWHNGRIQYDRHGFPARWTSQGITEDKRMEEMLAIVAERIHALRVPLPTVETPSDVQ